MADCNDIERRRRCTGLSFNHLALDPAVLDGQALVMCAARRGVGVTGPWNAPWGGWIRLVTHYGITDAYTEDAASTLTRAVYESQR